MRNIHEGLIFKGFEKAEPGGLHSDRTRQITRPDFLNHPITNPRNQEELCPISWARRAKRCLLHASDEDETEQWPRLSIYMLS